MSLGRRFKTFESISINGREMKSRVIRAKENVTTRLKIATSKPFKARENSATKARLVLDLNLIGCEGGTSFVDQSHCEVM